MGGSGRDDSRPLLAKMKPARLNKEQVFILQEKLKEWLANPERVRFKSWDAICKAFSEMCGFGVRETYIRSALTEVFKRPPEDILDKSSRDKRRMVRRRVTALEASLEQLTARVAVLEAALAAKT